jgi:hypothetical protein
LHECLDAFSIYLRCRRVVLLIFVEYYGVRWAICDRAIRVSNGWGKSPRVSSRKRTVYLHELLTGCALTVLGIVVVVDIIARVDAMLGFVL